MITDLFRRLKPLFPKQIERLWIEYHLGDPERQREINELLMVLAIKHQGMMVGEERLLLDHPPPEVIGRGEIQLGHTTYPGMPPSPVRVSRDELLRHLFVLGPTGTGKSTFLLGIITQLFRLRVPVMIFDFKRNFRCLLREHHPIVFTVGRNTAPLRINALRAPISVPFDEWVDALSDVISTSYLLLQGARNVLASALRRAHKQNDDATLSDAHAIISNELLGMRSGSRRYGWLESAARTLDELTKGGFGEALNHREGTPIDRLLEQSVIFELHGFGDDQKRCFSLLFLQAVLLIRKNGTARREKLQHVLVFDEAHNVFPREKYGEPSVPARLAREVREYGESIIAATQQSDVSESLIANSGFKIILRCDYPKDVTFAAQLLQIENRWLPRLALGHAIARFPTRHYQPFEITFTPSNIKNISIADSVVRKEWLTSHLSAPTATPLSEKAVALLQDIAAHPIAPITRRYAWLDWNAKTGNTAKDELIRKGLTTFEEVSTPTGRVKILSLTQAGAAQLTALGVECERGRRGGVEHEYWKWDVKRRLEREGYTVQEEFPIGHGMTVDLRASRDDEILWIEVETGRSDVRANIAKCGRLQGRILFIFTDAQIRDRYRDLVPGEALTVSDTL